MREGPLTDRGLSGLGISEEKGTIPRQVKYIQRLLPLSDKPLA